MNGRQNEEIDYELIVLEHARAVFVEPAVFMHRYRFAISATEDQPIADLLFRLRVAPETIGELRGGTGYFRGGKRLQARKLALASVWPLRKAISEARWTIIASRLAEKVKLDEVFFAPGSTPLSSEDPPGIARVNLAGEFIANTGPTDIDDAEEEEANRLDLEFSAAEETVRQVTGIAEHAIGCGQVNDPNALATALTSLKVALELFYLGIGRGESPFSFILS